MSGERGFSLAKTFTHIFKIYFGTLRKDLGRNGSLPFGFLFGLLVTSTVFTLAVIVERITVPSFESLEKSSGVVTQIAIGNKDGHVFIEVKIPEGDILRLHVSRVKDSSKAHRLIEQLQGRTISARWFKANQLANTWNELVQLSIGEQILIQYEEQKKQIERWTGPQEISVALFAISFVLFLFIQPMRYIRSKSSTRGDE